MGKGVGLRRTVVGSGELLYSKKEISMDINMDIDIVSPQCLLAYLLIVCCKKRQKPWKFNYLSRSLCLSFFLFLSIGQLQRNCPPEPHAVLVKSDPY